jgi:hypothetical protein
LIPAKGRRACSLAGVLCACMLAFPASAQSTAPTLSEAARQALQRAEKHVQEAIRLCSHWTTTSEAIKRARQAGAKGDNEEVLKQSAIASEQALLSIEQTRYPRVH